jgi:hypothetical protein
MIFFVMRRTMSDGGITIKTAELSGALGLTLFGARIILLDPRQSPEQWRCTLLHELIHLSRGPVAPEQAAAEEDIVSHLASLLLIPDGAQLAGFDWTLEGMRELARERGVDLETVEAALNPPTDHRLTAVTPRAAKSSVALAARSAPRGQLPHVVGTPHQKDR